MGMLAAVTFAYRPHCHR